MGRHQKNIYVFLSDESKKFRNAVQKADGSYTISKSSQPQPLLYTPPNIISSVTEFATNKAYFSPVRSISYPLDFIKDGAAILRDAYHLGKGSEEIIYVTIIEWNGKKGIYELSYMGKIDFIEKNEDPKSGTFTVPTMDDSAWGILSNNDSVVYSVECNERNPKAVRVLFDGVTLLNKYTYQTIQAPILQPVNTSLVAGVVIPLVLVNQDGDSSGIITKSQTGFDVKYPTSGFPNFDLLKTSPSWFLSTVYAINGVNITGSFTFQYNNNSQLSQGGGISLSVRTSFGPRFLIYRPPLLKNGIIYTTNFDFNLNLLVGESLFLVLEFGSTSVQHVTITPISTNIFVSTKTIQQPSIAYGLRPLDLLKELVAKATNNRFTINSNFFAVNNKAICLSGDSIRGVDNAKIYSSFSDWFQTFNSIFFIAIRSIKGNLWIEKATSVYNTDSSILDLGDVIDLNIEPASEYFSNEILAGSPKQDYRHPSGRLEVNSENSWSIPVFSVKNRLEIVTRYRTGCYDIQFLLLDYRGGSTQDNTGDKSVYIAQITDKLASALEQIATYENVNINNVLLQPIIKSPLNNDVISFNKPVIRGVSTPLNNVNIYVDNVLDGNTTSDALGDWSYTIVTALTPYVLGITTGQHFIESTYSDLAAPSSLINLLIDTSFFTLPNIIYPNTGDNLYNNTPLIKGISQQGSLVVISIDGTIVASITADNSCMWEFRSPVLSNSAHLISINGGADTSSINVDSNVSRPLITYIGSELDGFVIPNNLPLIKGVAQPGETVTLWLNYIRYAPLGVTVANASGNWSFQVVPVSYNDPVTGITIILAPIQNGVNVISTSLINYTVSIVKTAFQLDRPPYSSITGVTDNTVYNTMLSPKAMLENWYPMLASMLNKQKLDTITFEKPDKNGNQRTVLNGFVRAESDNIPASSLGKPIALLEYAKIKTKTKTTFAKTLYDFNNGGVIKFNFRGNDFYCLPIGGMKMNSITSDVQEWKLLMSPLTSYNDLLNLYKNGLKINVMKNSVYHSDYNSLHFVTYGFIPNAKFNHVSLYQDRFENRNEAWLYSPEYIQKFQKTETLIDQIIVNGVSNLSLKMYSCGNAKLIATIPYVAVTPAPIPLPDVVMQATIDFSLYPEDIYFFVMFSGELEISISEQVDLKEKHLGSILIESSSSINMVGAFFSTGFRTILRVEGLVKKLQPDISTIIARENDGDTDLIFSSVSRKRTIRFGTAYGLPDYLYLKVANALSMDNLLIEDVLYTLEDGEKINPSEDVEGHPLYYYNVNVVLNTNTSGNAFPGYSTGGVNTEGVVLVVDATAFGLPTGSLINIGIDNG